MCTCPATRRSTVIRPQDAQQAMDVLGGKRASIELHRQV
jgi:hypothetical protein